MSSARRSAPALWSALRYPALPLERLALADDETRPHAVTAVQGAQRRIVRSDSRAIALGAVSGLSLSGARALVPTLVAVDHDPDAVAARLDQLALAGYRYSSRVSLAAPDAVLIEIGASLRLFGGLGALLARVRDEANADRSRILIGTAPTPGAALLLARVGDERPVRTGAALRAALEPLAPDALQLDARTLQGLARSGIRTLGQLFDIAPAAVSRRFGHALVDTLYRLDGRLPDPQPPVAIPPMFEQGVELALEASSTGALTFVLRRLVSSLSGFLRARDLGAGELVLVLRHRRRTPTRVVLRFSEPTGDRAHLGRTAEERLARTVLPEPVTHLSLRTGALASVERDAATLLDAGGPRRASRAEVIDALVARFGRERVYTVRVVDGHRPETSWGRVSGPVDAVGGAWPARPLWLLARPERATAALTAALEIASAPERIETGWWQVGSDTRRDYFVARDVNGTHYWVFRDRGDATGAVWIHGLFA